MEFEKSELGDIYNFMSGTAYYTPVRFKTVENMSAFTSALHDISEECIPKSSTRTKRRNPWFNDECKQPFSKNWPKFKMENGKIWTSLMGICLTVIIMFHTFSTMFQNITHTIYTTSEIEKCKNVSHDFTVTEHMLWSYWLVPSFTMFDWNWSLLKTVRIIVPKMFHADDADHFYSECIYMKVSTVLSCLYLSKL